MKCIQIGVRDVVAKLVGTSQVAYLPDGRQISDTTILAAELAVEMEREGQGGVMVQVDNRAAFDLVR